MPHDSKTRPRSPRPGWHFRGRRHSSRAAALVAPGGHSAIHDDFRAGDETCLIRREEQRRIGGVAAVAHETDGNALEPGFGKGFNVAARALVPKPILNQRSWGAPADD